MFTAETQSVDCASSTFCVDVDVTNFIEIIGMQYALQWDTSQYDYVSHQFFLSNTPTSVVDTDEGYMAFTWSWFGSPTTGLILPDDSVIIQLCLDVKGNAGTSSMIEFVPQPGQVIEVIDRPRGQLTIGTDVIFTDATLTITDTQAPVITCPADVTSSTSIVNGIGPASLSDNCAIETVAYTLGGVSSGSGMNDASGMSYPNGLTTISYTATDYAGNSNSCAFNLTVNDTTPSNKLIFDPQATLDCATGRLTIDIHVFNFDSIISMQYGIFWDTLILNYLSHTNLNLPSATFITSVADSGKIAMFWSQTPPNPDGYSLPDNTILFQLEYDVVGPLSIPLITFDTIPPLDLEIADVNGRLDTTEFMFLPGSINVVDNTPPILSACPADITLNAIGGACGSNYFWTAPTATDNCDVSPTVTGSHAPGAFFNVGVDTVVYIATDMAGNADTCSFMVTVEDNTNPTISCPSNVNVNTDAGQCTAVVNNIAPTTMNDNCAFTVAYAITGETIDNGMNDASGTAFNPGTSTITYTITDASGNTGTCSFDVVVTDNEAPSISCPNNIITGMDIGQCSATINNIAPTAASDNCPSAITFTLTGATSGMGNDDASGTAFSAGVTTITYVNTDSSGNSSSCSFTITVNDNLPPTISCPANISVNTDAGQCNANVTVPQPTTSDNCSTVLLSNDFNASTNASGTYPIGTTTVTWTASDPSGNSTTCQMTVTVTDNENPVVTCPSDVTVDITSGSSAVVTGINPVASDNCGIADTTYTLSNATTGSGSGSASGQSFNTGTTLVTYTITDVNGNTSNCSFGVTVRFVTSDIISCPGDQAGFTDANQCGTVVNSIAPIILINPADVTSLTYCLAGATTATGVTDASGSFFNLGTTIVKYFAEDNSGNFDTCQFLVIITDNVAPVLSNCPAPVTVSATSNCEATANWAPPTATDNCAASLSSSHTPGAIFPLGSTIVTYTASDNAGNTATCSFTVTVVDDTAPSFSNCPMDITVDAPSGTCTSAVSWTPPTANDDCVVTVNTSHNPGSIFQVGSPTTVTYTATDQGGNTAVCSFTVTVQDVTPPNIANCQLNNLQLDYLNDCRAVANWDAISATDACSVVTITCTNNPGDTLPVGVVTEVICIAVDAAGNSARCTLQIDIPDNEDPVIIDCPMDITVNTDPGVCSALVLWTAPTATDNCGFVDLSESTAPGSSFDSGTTLVTYLATDASGNTTECTFNVTVQDMEAPVMSCDSIVVSVDGTIISDASNMLITVTPDNTCQGVKLDFNAPSATDNCDGVISSVQTDNTGLGSGSTFPGGTTTLEFTSTDAAGNSTTCEVMVRVIALDPISVSILPAAQLCAGSDITLVANNVPAGATISWTGPNNFQSDMTSPTITGVTTADAGIFTATITLMNGCETSGTQALNVDPAPIIEATSDSPVCNGSLNLQGQILPGSPAITDWFWQFPNNLTDDTQNPVVPNATNDYAGTYIVTATSLNGCMTSDTIEVEVANIPGPQLQASCDDAICLGEACLLMERNMYRARICTIGKHCLRQVLVFRIIPLIMKF